MKRLAAILFASLALLFTPTQSRADLVISNNAIIQGFGDSQDADGTGTPSTGYMRQHYIHSYFALNYPQYNLKYYDWGRSGGTMDDRLTNMIHPDGLPCWGYQSNNFQHIGISFNTVNAGLSSNQMYLAQSNVTLAPVTMSDGAFPLVTQSGWAATHPVQWIVVGTEPAIAADAGDSSSPPPREQDAACTNAGINLGVAGVTLFYPLVVGWTNDAVATGGNTIGYFAGTSKSDHIEAPGQVNMAIAAVQQITTDTNISTCTIDFNAAIAAATNHCVIYGLSKSGNSVTGNRLDDRLPMAFDISTTDPTNAGQLAFQIIPSQADAFWFTFKLTNCPVGNYDIAVDGVLIGHNIPSTVLTSEHGWNMFTNTVGPYWNQRYEVLGRIRDLAHVDRYTRVPIGNPSDGLGEQSLGSTAFSKWTSGYKGDALIAQMDSKVGQLQTNFDAIHAAAQPTNHTFTISMPATVFAPFHR